MENYTNRDEEVPIEVLGADRKAVPFQIIRNEHLSLKEFPWRKRIDSNEKTPTVSFSLRHRLHPSTYSQTPLVSFHLSQCACGQSG